MFFSPENKKNILLLVMDQAKTTKQKHFQPSSDTQNTKAIDSHNLAKVIKKKKKIRFKTAAELGLHI